MSSLAYGALTRKREEATPDQSSSEQAPGLRSYVDTLAALVPAEVLTLHGLIINATTNTSNAEGSPTTITAPGTLQVAFVALIVLSIALYVAGHVGQPAQGSQWISLRWDSLDYVRMFIPAFAFVGWTMLQKSTAFDAVWPSLPDPARFTSALIGGVILVAVAGLLAYQADQQPPK